MKLVGALLVSILCLCVAVDRSKFRKCSDTGFCRRYRDKSGPIFGQNVRLLYPPIEEPLSSLELFPELISSLFEFVDRS